MKKVAIVLLTLLSVSGNAYYFRCVDLNGNQTMQISANSKSVIKKEIGHRVTEAYLDLTINNGASYISMDGDLTTEKTSALFLGKNGLKIGVSYDQDENAHKVIARDRSSGIIFDQYLRCHSKL